MLERIHRVIYFMYAKQFMQFLIDCEKSDYIPSVNLYTYNS